MIYDVFSYNGEKDILDIRLHMLDRYVDRFIVVEAKTTVAGEPKPLYFGKDEQFFKPWWPKIDYFIIDEDYSVSERNLAKASPTPNAFLQSESIKKALYQASDDDLVYIGEVNEIWDGHYQPLIPEKLMQRVYAHQLNNESNEIYWGTIVGTWGSFKDKVLTNVRSDIAIRGLEYAGWHFTAMDQRSSLSTPTDYRGRSFRFTIDESNWPQYLKKNHKQYKHLMQ